MIMSIDVIKEIPASERQPPLPRDVFSRVEAVF